MDKQHELEIRIHSLERHHDDLDGRFVAALRTDAHMIGDLLFRVRNLEERVRDLDQLENIALASYEKTHPNAVAKLEEIRVAIESARRRISMSNLPANKSENPSSES